MVCIVLHAIHVRGNAIHVFPARDLHAQSLRRVHHNGFMRLLNTSYDRMNVNYPETRILREM